MPAKVLILLSCRKIGYGAVVKDVEPMTVVAGNPAKEFNRRKCIHINIIVESLLGGDFEIYHRTWKQKTTK